MLCDQPADGRPRLGGRMGEGWPPGCGGGSHPRRHYTRPPRSRRGEWPCDGEYVATGASFAAR
jgi:hypothetical protein